MASRTTFASQKNMKKLSEIPNSITDRHENACFAPIKGALDLLCNNQRPVFGKAGSSNNQSNGSISAAAALYFKYVRKQFVVHHFLTATARKLRNIVNHWQPPPLNSADKEQADMLLKRIFDYDAFRQGKTPCFQNGHFYWTKNRTGVGGYEYLAYHYKNVKYCPYCNADAIYVFRTADGREIFSAFDHFFLRDEYPFLALSLYNLIPTCYRCNSQLKTVADMRTIANPFIEDMHSNVFFFPVLHRIGLQSNVPCRIILCPHERCSPKAHAFVQLFELERLYSTSFAKDAWMCIEIVRQYTPEFRRHMASVIGHKDPRLVETLFFGMPLDESEINKTRLGKMTLDIVERFHV